MNESVQPAHDPIPQAKRRSRWPARLALLLFLIAGATAGYFSTRPLYRAQGLIQFRQPLSALHDDTPRPIDPSYIEGEALAARSPTIVDLTMQGTNWAPIGRPLTPASKEWFTQHLNAQPAAAGTIAVSFLDPDPAIASAACKAAVLAYSDYWRSHREQEETTRLQVLRDRTSLVAGTLARLDNQILSISNDSVGADLSTLHNAQIQEVVRLEREIREAQNPAPPAKHDVPAYLTARYEQAKLSAEKTGQTMMKLDEFRLQRDAQAARLTLLQNRIAELTVQLNMMSPMSILSTSSVPATPAIDHRPRNAALGVLAALLLYLILKLLWRNWQNHLRFGRAKTAFPVIITHTPKPVIPIAEFTGLATT
jgi:hypothetical protein